MVGRLFAGSDLSLRPLLRNLKDLRRYLKTDLTSAGVVSIQEQLGGVSNQAASVKQTLQVLFDELNRVGRELSPVTPAAEQPSPGK